MIFQAKSIPSEGTLSGSMREDKGIKAIYVSGEDQDSRVKNECLLKIAVEHDRNVKLTYLFNKNVIFMRFQSKFIKL